MELTLKIVNPVVCELPDPFITPMVSPGVKTVRTRRTDCRAQTVIFSWTINDAGTKEQLLCKQTERGGGGRGGGGDLRPGPDAEQQSEVNACYLSIYHQEQFHRTQEEPSCTL